MRHAEPEPLLLNPRVLGWIPVHGEPGLWRHLQTGKEFYNAPECGPFVFTVDPHMSDAELSELAASGGLS